MKKETKWIRQSVGADMAKDDFKAAISVMDEQFHIVVKATRSFANNQKGFKEFIEWVNKKSIQEQPLSFVMEATGVYYESLAYYLEENNRKAHVVLPNQAKKYIQSLGLKSKTDKIDAKALSRMGLERNLYPWKPLSGNLRQLKQLTRERDAIIRERTSASNQLHAYKHQARPCKESIRRSEKRITFLDKQIKETEIQIDMIVQKDQSLLTRLKYLMSIPGVALLTAVIIVAETDGFAAITSIKQLTSYAGMDIQIAESGKWKGHTKISKKGNSYIRKALYFPAFCKIKHDKNTGHFYQRLAEKKGKRMIAAVAVQRKLLALMYTLWKKEEMFTNNYAA